MSSKILVMNPSHESANPKTVLSEPNHVIQHKSTRRRLVFARVGKSV